MLDEKKTRKEQVLEIAEAILSLAELMEVRIDRVTTSICGIEETRNEAFDMYDLLKRATQNNSKRNGAEIVHLDIDRSVPSRPRERVLYGDRRLIAAMYDAMLIHANRHAYRHARAEIRYELMAKGSSTMHRLILTYYGLDRQLASPMVTRRGVRVDLNLSCIARVVLHHHGSIDHSAVKASRFNVALLADAAMHPPQACRGAGGKSIDEDMLARVREELARLEAAGNLNKVIGLERKPIATQVSNEDLIQPTYRHRVVVCIPRGRKPS